MYDKHMLIKILREVAFCVIEETSNGVNCSKNRFGERNVYDCKDYDFEKVKLSELNCGATEINTLYYGKNIWLLLEQ